MTTQPVSLGDPSKDARYVELLEKELRLKREKFENGTDPSLKEEIKQKAIDFVAKCNALGLHYIQMVAPPDYDLARKFLKSAEAVVLDEAPYRKYFSSESSRLKMLSATYQNLGALEKQARLFRAAVDYHNKAIEIELRLKDLRERGLDRTIIKKAESARDGADNTPDAAAPVPDADSHAINAHVATRPLDSISNVSPKKPTFGSSDSTALLQACRRGQSAQALEIIRRGTAALDVCDPAGNTALHHACQNKLIEVVEEMCKLGVPLDAINLAGNTPLHFTASSSLELTRILLRSGASISTQDNSGSTALHYACLAKLPDIAQLLLENGADVRKADQSGNTPLHYAVTSNLTGIVELLIGYQANVDAKDQHKNTPLHYACSLVLPSMAIMLLHHHANPNVVNGNGNTPLLYACSNSLQDIALTLIKKGADLTCTDEQGNSPLHYACANKLEAVARVLIDNPQVDCDLPNNQRNTPLHYACSSNNLPIVQMLVLRGVNLQAQDLSLNTPLHYACLNEKPEVAELLISRGANVNVQNSEGKTPLDYASAL